MATVAATLVVAALILADAVPSGAAASQTPSDSGTGMDPQGPTMDTPGDGTSPAVPSLALNGFLRSERGRLTAVAVPQAEGTAPLGPVLVSGTGSSGVNNQGQIVGSYPAGGRLHGFLLDDGEVTTIDVPGASWTALVDINNVGQITGSYIGGDGDLHGFVRSRRGRFTRFDFPGGARTAPHKINDRGEITGLWSQDGGSGSYRTAHGFLRDSRGRFTSIDAPGAVRVTDPQGINDQRDIVGVYEDANGRNRGFLRDRRGRFTTIDLSDVSTSITGVNDQRQMVGSYVDADGMERGFLRYGSGRFTSFDGPGSEVLTTVPLDVNERREVVGFSVTLPSPSNQAPRTAM